MNEQPTQTSCPYCHSKKGYVRAVEVAPGNEYTLTYTCADCHRHWEGQAHVRPSPFGTSPQKRAPRIEA